jgi:predicted nucleic acid-binding protein
VIKYVFDSSAVLRFLDKEAGAERVRAVFRVCAAGEAEPYISAVQWGEIVAVQRKRSGAREQERVLTRLIELQFRVVPVTDERAVRAAELRVDRKMSNADSYAIELAMDSPDHLLVTADYDFKAVDDLARIEFLPVK